MFRLISTEVLSDNWGILTRYEFELRRRNGEWQRQTRETYDRGNGATCLLFNPETTCVLLTRQFRLPVFLNGGVEALIETPAGLLEGSDAGGRMRAELLEETGFQTPTLTHLFDIYMSPGSVTEYLSFFKGIYSASDQVAVGGGKLEEGEDIEVLEVSLSDAMKMIESGDIRDAKTIILLQHLMIETLQKSLEYP
ncbi:NUDIX domain-containing protein [Ruegeria sp. EL01]|jgi:nudix-type nucleoside diphosphatase (YffH/AdpP family)|uniref:NUDIX domain-containing protein n=1 Tax=Ruegeria sp. EL01 TaxID=2107578 RepID=UPI000EA7F5D1|nr:NUDIX domain-containing protein [Ruegeria sp. EL01]